MHQRLKHLLIAVTIFFIEILIATKLEKVKFVRDYIGDFLVVILIYHLIKSVIDISSLKLAVFVFLFSLGVESAQYFQIADKLGFPRGSLPSIVIGTSFSTADLFMYFLGCLTVYYQDAVLFP